MSSDSSVVSPALSCSFHVANEDYQQAYNMMQELRSRAPKVNMANHVNLRNIETVHRALGIPLGRGTGAERDDEVPEDL